MSFLSWREKAPSLMGTPVADFTNERRPHTSTTHQEQTNDEEDSDDSGQVPAIQTFDDIAVALERFKTQVDIFESRCAAYEVQVQGLRLSLKESDGEKEHLRQGLQKSIRDHHQSSSDIAQLQRAIAGKGIAKLIRHGPVQPFIQQLQNQRSNEMKQLANIEKSRIQMQAKKADLEEQVQALQIDNADLADKVIDLTRHNRILQQDSKQIDFMVESSTTSFPSTAFVMVLIDGDAFTWSRSLFASQHPLSPHSTPGGLAAHNLKTEIVKYMLAHPDQIPASSKIVVRVMCNAASYSRNFGKGNNAASRHFDFMEQFTEAMPLFDYYHAGTGKERVDVKIHETIQLFLHNPLCTKMFLACSTDNGFARVLEQHVNDAVARRKLCIITSGYSVPEIARLGLEEMEFPSVFVHRPTPLNLAQSIKKKQQQQIQQIQQRQREAAQQDFMGENEGAWRQIVSGRSSVRTSARLGLRTRNGEGQGELSSGHHPWVEDGVD